MEFKFDKPRDSTSTLVFSGELSELGGVSKVGLRIWSACHAQQYLNTEKISVAHRELSKRETFSTC